MVIVMTVVREGHGDSVTVVSALIGDMRLYCPQQDICVIRETVVITGHLRQCAVAGRLEGER